MKSTNGRSSKRTASTGGGVMSLERRIPGTAALYALLNGPHGEMRFLPLRGYTVDHLTSLAGAALNDAPDKRRKKASAIDDLAKGVAWAARHNKNIIKR